MFIDTHCHLFFDSYFKDLASVIETAEAAGVEKLIIPGIDIPSCELALKISEKFQNVYVAIGIHPNDLDLWDENTISTLTILLNHRKAVAIGEIGLDYYRNPSTALIQQNIFRAQLDLAEKSQKPVIIHERNAENDLTAILSDYDLKGIFHGFSGSKIIQTYGLNHPFLFGIGGPITYKKQMISTDSLSIIRNKIVLETDSPFLSPIPFRGKRNEPKNLPLVAARIADLLNCDIMSIAKVTTSNANNLFFSSTIIS